jgi:PAS domain S-box-containing protein
MASEPASPAAIPFWNQAGYRQLLAHLPAAAYTCDAQGLITFYNARAVETWGREPKLNDPIDRYCGSFKLYLPDGTPINHAECWMAKALHTRREYMGQEILVERPDGSRLLVLAHANPYFDEQGELLGAVNVLVDVSDRQRMLDVQAWLAAIVASSEDAIVSKDLEGRVTSWNTAAERMFGYLAAEMVGEPITKIIPPDRLHEEVSILARLRRGERVEHFETVRQAKDGHLLEVSLTVSPIRDQHGKVIGASKIARDITARRQTERALVALNQQLETQLADLRRLHDMSGRLSSTLEVAPILEEALRTAMQIEGAEMGLLSISDPEQGVLRIGASAGFDAEFLTAIETMPPAAGARGACLQERRRIIIEDTEADPYFEPFREVARRAGFRAVHSTPLITRSGRIVGVLSTHFREPRRPSDRECHLIDLCARQAVDYIENARLYEQLREADRKKDEFLATLAHELRNPLAPISYSLQILKLEQDLSPATAQLREMMERQVQHLVRLVDDLLEVSRITRGKITLRKESVELVSILGSAVETSRPTIDASGHQLAIQISPEPMRLDADPVRLAQVVANLLNNAAKYTEPGGQIWLTARPNGGEAVISIRDTGMGIPPEMLARIFDMFMQVDRTVKRSQGGLGIGLTLSQSLVQLHGGTIEAKSEGLGKGSEFIVRLPLGSAAPEAEPPPDAALPDAAPLSKATG